MNGIGGPPQVLTLAELRDLPEPTWLVDNVIPEQSLAVLVGKDGVGKSLLALDLSLSVASGTDWHGLPVTAGGVLYIAAEGGARMFGRRVVAWEQEHPAAEAGGRFRLVDGPVDLAPGEELGQFVRERVETLPWKPSLLVVDTLARCLVGDENNGRDMGAFISAVDSLRATYGLAALVLHHPTKTGTTERGHSALMGAADTRTLLRGISGAETELRCVKQRGAEEFPTMTFRRESRQVGLVGQPVLVRIQEPRDRAEELDERILAALAEQEAGEWLTQAQALADVAGSNGAKSARLKALAADTEAPVESRTVGKRTQFRLAQESTQRQAA